MQRFLDCAEEGEREEEKEEKAHRLRGRGRNRRRRRLIDSSLTGGVYESSPPSVSILTDLWLHEACHKVN